MLEQNLETITPYWYKIQNSHHSIMTSTLTYIYINFSNPSKKKGLGVKRDLYDEVGGNPTASMMFNNIWVSKH